MTDQAKIPTRFIWGAAITRPVGSGRSAFDLESMRIDSELNGWINPFSKPAALSVSQSGERVPTPGQKLLYLERVEGGYRVDLTHTAGHHWTVGPKPEPVGGMEWIPVVEFIAPELNPEPGPT
jgi:hypothetical protein